MIVSHIHPVSYQQSIDCGRINSLSRRNFRVSKTLPAESGMPNPAFTIRNITICGLCTPIALGIQYSVAGIQ